MGNICRSPTAHGVFRKKVQEAQLSEKIDIDSAGTHAYHVGETPDLRAQDAALKHHIDMSDLRARQVHQSDFEEFDYILAMDKENLSLLRQQCPTAYQHKVQLFLDFAENINAEEVPDPYYGGTSGFDRVFALVAAASSGLLRKIQQSA